MIKETSKVKEYKFGYYITEFEKKPEINYRKKELAPETPHNDYRVG